MSSLAQGIFDDPNTFNEKQAARYMGVSLSTLRRRRAARRDPAFIQFDRRILYRKSALDKTLDDHTVQAQEPEAQQPSLDKPNKAHDRRGGKQVQ